jgi:hypothetical protein
MGKVICTNGTSHGSSCTLTCDSEMEPAGASMTTCSDGVWSEELKPQCVGAFSYC